MKFFTKEEDDFLRNNYLNIPAKRMSKILGRSESGARQRLKLLGLETPKEVSEKFKSVNQFKKGSVPFNKGRKMSKEVYERCKDTMFKKGNTPNNHKPLGSIRITKDGYQEIKVAEPNVWDAYHRLMWEETFGQIPEGGVVRFVTKDKLNVHPFNLELVDRCKNMELNSWHNYPKDIQLVIQMRGALTRQINKHEKYI